MYENITKRIGIIQNNTFYFKRNVDPTLQVAVFSAIGVISFVTNLIIIFIIYTHRIIRTRSNSLLINLAISDILVVVIGVPIQSTNLLSKNGPVTVGAVCQLHGALVLLTFLVSNFNLVLIAAYRYLLIVKPKVHDFLFSKVNLLFIILITYLTVGVIVLPALLNWGNINYNPFRAHCMVVWEYSISYLLFLQFFAFNIPLGIIGFCYYKIITCTINSRKRLHNTVDNKVKFQEQRLTCMLLVVVGCFFTCFMPYAILLYYEGAFKKRASEIFSFCAMVFAYFNSTLDFFIYSIMNAKFRRALKIRIVSIMPVPINDS
ncbi:melatonin receptor type 1A isoform X1 [Hydra vulgaris]|nr:melatonin receptor type 1A-like [Hydra vulgaris]